MAQHPEELAFVGKQVRALRSEKGITQRQLAELSGVSARYLSQLEAGSGNISLGRLFDIASALEVPLARLVQPQWAQAPESFQRLCSLVEAGRGREALVGLELLAAPPNQGRATLRRIALLGVRGAGKSTIGARLAQHLGLQFVELDHLIEQAAGLPLGEIFGLHGEAYYRQLETAALSQLLNGSGEFVLATGGSIVTNAANFQRLQQETTTVWLKADAESHWQRVVAQGDFRPMAELPHAMDDLRGLLAARTPLYAQAKMVCDTQSLDLENLVAQLAQRFAAA